MSQGFCPPPLAQGKGNKDQFFSGQGFGDQVETRIVKDLKLYDVEANEPDDT
jgi:hypothetical protein